MRYFIWNKDGKRVGRYKMTWAASTGVSLHNTLRFAGGSDIMLHSSGDGDKRNVVFHLRELCIEIQPAKDEKDTYLALASCIDKSGHPTWERPFSRETLRDWLQLFVNQPVRVFGDTGIPPLSGLHAVSCPDGWQCCRFKCVNIPEWLQRVIREYDIPANNLMNALAHDVDGSDDTS